MVKTQFSIALHIMSLLALYPDDWHSSSLIARSININPVQVRREIAILKAGDLIESKEGKLGGVRILKSAKEIYLSDIFNLIKGDGNVLTFTNNEPSPSCRIGRQIHQNLKEVMDTIDNSILEALKKQTLEEFKLKF